MKTKRDTQKSKVMAAEYAWATKIRGYLLIDEREARRLADWILRYEGIPTEHFQIIREKRMPSSNHSFRVGHWINLYLPPIINSPIVIHEMAHIVSLHRDHGPEFCKTMLRLVRNNMGMQEAGALLEAYRTYRVRLHV